MASTLPNERITFRYTQRPKNKPAEEVELPLRLLAMGNYQGDVGNKPFIPLCERKAYPVDQSTFYATMAAMNAALTIRVPDYSVSLDNPPAIDLALRFGSLDDFHPDAIIEQVPTLRYQLKLRDLLVKLRHSSSTTRIGHTLQAIIDLSSAETEEECS